MLNEGDLSNPIIEVKEIIEAINPKGKTILEIGCGLGPHAKHISKIAKSYEAIDVIKEKIEDAKKENTQENLVFKHMDASSLEYNDEIFDAVIACHSIHEAPCISQGKIYREAHRVLKNGQYMLILDPDPRKHSEFQKCFDIVHEDILDYNHYYCCAHANWVQNKIVKQEKLFEVVLTKEIDLIFEFNNAQEIVDLIVSDFKYETKISKEQEKEILDKLKSGVLKNKPDGKLHIEENLSLVVLKKIG